MGIECAILGDSIAVGVAQQRAYCYRDAVVGISSQSFLKRITVVNANHVLISLGSNDSASMATENNLQQVRAGVAADTVTWLLSANNAKANAAARSVARAFGDRVIEIREWVGTDGVHPTAIGYKTIADKWLPTMVIPR